MAVTIHAPADVAPAADRLAVPPEAASRMPKIGTRGVTLRRPMATPKKPTKPRTKVPATRAATEDPAEPKPPTMDVTHFSSGLSALPSGFAGVRVVFHHVCVPPTNATEPERDAAETETETLDLPEGTSFADAGREVARAAQRTLLLAQLESQAWNLSAVAKALGMGTASTVIRAIRSLGLQEQYDAARASGAVRPGPRRWHI